MCRSDRLLLVAADLGGILPHTDLLILHPGIRPPGRRKPLAGALSRCFSPSGAGPSLAVPIVGA